MGYGLVQSVTNIHVKNTGNGHFLCIIWNYITQRDRLEYCFYLKSANIEMGIRTSIASNRIVRVPRSLEKILVL